MAAPEPQCMPCRGTGQVISNLGGESRHVSCSWCRGSGVRTTGIDAQAAWRGSEAAGTGAGGDGQGGTAGGVDSELGGSAAEAAG